MFSEKTNALVNETISGVFGLITSVTVSIHSLTLSEEQVVAFCEATPNGVELWEEFRAAQRMSAAPDTYGFGDFIKETLAKTEHPYTAG